MEGEVLASVEPGLRIRVLHSDESIVVIEKPCNLRSVPGNLTTAGSKRPRSKQKTSQEAWIAALKSFLEHQPTDESDQQVLLWLEKLSRSSGLDSIPRKLEPFLRYCARNQHRLVPGEQPWLDGKDLDGLARRMHTRLADKQRSLMNLPEATKHEDSAYGQLFLLGTASETGPKNLFVVHRLDCETSGVMVFARTQQAASALGEAWRERDRVRKTYVACVKRWPPYTDKNQTEGEIKFPLSPSHERPKWKVDLEGKPCMTKWKLRSHTSEGFILELTPVTGRTHQLRIHLAAVGSGIVGDSLYGDEPTRWSSPGILSNHLHLHSEALSFQHPETEEQMEFSVRASW